MAATRFTPLGVIIEFDHGEVTQIIRNMNGGSGAAAAFAGMLAHMGVSGTATAIFSVGAALLKTGAATLNLCNSKQTGIFLHVLWVGPFWCKPR
jgi:hypothetical protein